MIVTGLLQIIFLLLKVIITPIAAILDVADLNSAISGIWVHLQNFFDMISSGFGLAAYFFHWDVIRLMISAILIVSIAEHSYKLIMWIYNKIPFIH